MKSFLSTACHIDIVPLLEPPDERGSDLADADLQVLLARRAVSESHDHIALHDVVTLTLSGSTPRTNRTDVRVVVGTGYFDAEIEQALVGRPVAKPFVIRVGGEAVQAYVSSAIGRVIPAPTDELVSELTGGTFGGVAAFLAARAEAHASQRAATYETEALFALLDAVTEGNDVIFDDSEIACLVENELAECRRQAAQEGLVFEEMSSAELEARVAASSVEEFVERSRQRARTTITRALVESSHSGIAPDGFDVDRIRALAGSLSQRAREHVRTAVRSSDSETPKE